MQPDLVGLGESGYQLSCMNYDTFVLYKNTVLYVIRFS